MKRTLAPALLVVWGSICVLTAVSSFGDDEKLKDALGDKLLSGDWIYDDIEAGYAEAEKAGKPMLVSFRCVP